jgi:hypothetical protein
MEKIELLKKVKVINPVTKEPKEEVLSITVTQAELDAMPENERKSYFSIGAKEKEDEASNLKSDPKPKKKGVSGKEKEEEEEPSES